MPDLSSKLGLGGVQLGMPYGVMNLTGQPSQAEVADILTMSHQAGIHAIDTAPGYGTSEQCIGALLPTGHGMRIVTKCRILKVPISAADVELVEQTFQQSMSNLRLESIHGLLSHRVGNLLGDGGDLLFDALRRWKQQGLVQKVGVSLYKPEELIEVMRRFPIDIVQLPLHVLNQRFASADLLSELERNKIEVHVRSAFLQGVLVADVAQLPAWLDPMKPTIARFQDHCRSNGLTPLQGALLFCMSQPGVSCVLVGVASVEQLQQTIEACRSMPEVDLGFSEFDCSDNELINPSSWPNAM